MLLFASVSDEPIFKKVGLEGNSNYEWQIIILAHTTALEKVRPCVVPSKFEALKIINPCKRLAYRDLLFRVPGRTRTVDIQNHKHFGKFSGIPSVHCTLKQLKNFILRLFCGDWRF